MTETAVPSDTMRLRIVVFRENRFWLAQGLEHDLGAQADDLRDLLCRLAMLLEQEAAALAALPPAPRYFQDLWPLKAGMLVSEGTPFAPGIELGMVA